MDVLAQRDVVATARDGFNLWLPVAHERDALVVLAARGIGAAPGRPFVAEQLAGDDHLRITTAGLAVPDAEPIADAARRRYGAPHR